MGERIIQYFPPRLPAALTIANSLDSMQRKLLRPLFYVARYPFESDAQFWPRYWKTMNTSIQTNGGFWRRILATRICSWYEHLLRHQASPAYQMLQYRGPAFLEARRRLFPDGRLGIRRKPGAPCRWLNDFFKDTDLENPDRDKRLRNATLKDLRPGGMCPKS